MEQNIDILGANLCTFHLDPSIVQRFAPFSAWFSVLVFLHLEWKYKKLYFFHAFYRLASFSVLSFVSIAMKLHSSQQLALMRKLLALRP